MTLALSATLSACAAPPAGEPGAGEQAAATAAPGPAAGPAVGWALAIHGGAGSVPRDLDEEVKRGRIAALESALARGSEILAGGGSALDAVEAVVLMLEEDPLFNAGKGAVLTHEGTHELDAAIMDGSSLAVGAVAGVRTVRNPIRLARAVMERSPHVFMIGDGAEAFAAAAGLERVDNSWFDTPERRAELERALEREREEGAPVIGGRKMGTVGAVALDRHGHLAAATSTGGMTNKRFGRVGDVPVIGAGTYADDRSCAVSATGTGEQFIRHTVARSIAARVQHLGEGVEAAAQAVIAELDPGDGGVIVVGRDGSVALVFNSTGMYRGAADATGRAEVGIWEEMTPASR